MTTSFFIRIRSKANASRLVHELLHDGIEAHQLRVHAAHPPNLPISRITYRTTAKALRQGIAAGALLALAMALILLWLDAAESEGLLLLPLLGAAVGGAFWWQRNRARNRDVLAQQPALERGEMLLVLDLDDDQAGRIESRVSARHPEVAILGSDAAGTPPFP